MDIIIQLFQAHPYSLSVVSTWLFNNIVTAAITSMPAPTAGSSKSYVWFFTFSNTVIGNISRARSTTIEKSPNFQDAVAKVVNGSSTTSKP